MPLPPRHNGRSFPSPAGQRLPLKHADAPLRHVPRTPPAPPDPGPLGLCDIRNNACSDGANLTGYNQSGVHEGDCRTTLATFITGTQVMRFIPDGEFIPILQGQNSCGTIDQAAWQDLTNPSPQIWLRATEPVSQITAMAQLVLIERTAAVTPADFVLVWTSVIRNANGSFSAFFDAHLVADDGTGDIWDYHWTNSLDWDSLQPFPGADFGFSMAPIPIDPIPA